MDSSAFISNTLDPDNGWMEMKPEYHQMLTRFHPLNETSQVVEKINSSAATGKVANSMSACSLEEGGSCTKFTKRGMGRGRGRRKAIPEDDTFIHSQMEKYLGSDYIQSCMLKRLKNETDHTYLKRQTESPKSSQREIDNEDEAISMNFCSRLRESFESVKCIDSDEVKKGQEQESSDYFHGFLSLEHYLEDLKIAKERDSNRNLKTLNYTDDDGNLDQVESYVFLSEKSTIIQDIDSD